MHCEVKRRKMFVVVMLEWDRSQGKSGRGSVKLCTQLTALRVDQNWHVLSKYSAYIKTSKMASRGKGIAEASGGVQKKGRGVVFSELDNWLKEDDRMCLWSDSQAKSFLDLYSSTLKKAPSLPLLVINPLLGKALNKKIPMIDVLQFAKQRHIDIPEPSDDSENKVIVMLRLLKDLNVPQKKLLTADAERNAQIQNARNGISDAIAKGDYLLDLNQRVIHRADCSYAPFGSSAQFVVSLEKYLFHGYTACDCIGNVTLNREKYLRAESDGAGNKEEQRVDIQSIAKTSRKAISRQRQAQSERLSFVENGELTEQEKNDLYTLTQPRFMFFSAKGYSSFHLRACSKLVGDHITGYATFADAMRSNHIPCKVCRPSNKHDANISIPIGSTIRESEKTEDLIAMCRAYQYDYSFENCYFCIDTLAGKWRINMLRYPITVDHVNLLKGNGKEYHRQPRQFLSLQDAILYIHRHDETLLSRKKS